MRRLSSFVWLLAIAWLLVPTGVASAVPIIIDDFTTGLSVSGGIINNTGTSTELNVPGLFGVGTTDRTTTVTGMVGTGISTTSINTLLQRFAHQDVPDAKLDVSIAYTDFGTIDFTNLVIDLPFFSYNDGTQNSNLLVTVTLGTPSGNLTSSQTVLAGMGGPFTLSFPFSGFTGPGNITQVTGVTFSFQPQGTGQGTGFILDGAAGVQINAIPEPTSLAAWSMLALAGAWMGRRQIQRRARPA